MLVFAHPSHWLVSIAYMAPLIFLVVVIAVGKVRDRRNRAAEPVSTVEAPVPEEDRP